MYVNPNGYIGGAETFVLNICQEHLHEQRIDVSILFFNAGAGVQWATDKGIKTHVINKPFRLSRPLSLLNALVTIRHILGSEEPNILHLTMPYSHIVMYFAALGLNIKTVWFQHGPVGGLLDKIARFLPVDLTLFNSEFTQSAHNQLAGLKERRGQKRIRTLVPYSKISTADSQKLRRQLLGKNGELLIGMAGRITEWKGFHVFLDSIIHLKYLFGQDFQKLRFVIVGTPNTGRDHEYHDSLLQFVKINQLQEAVTFTGFVDEMHPYLSAMDYFIHASIIPEPLGAIVAEAMLQNAVVVGSEHGGLHEFLIDGKTGYTFDSMAEDADRRLADALYLAIGRSDNGAIRTNAYRHVASQYLPGPVTRRMEALYQELLAN